MQNGGEPRSALSSPECLPLSDARRRRAYAGPAARGWRWRRARRPAGPAGTWTRRHRRLPRFGDCRTASQISPGFYDSIGRGANYGVEEHTGTTLTPPGQGIVVDPPDGKLPMQEWAKRS